MFRILSATAGNHRFSTRGRAGSLVAFGVAFVACASPTQAPEDTGSGGARTSGGAATNGGAMSSGGAIVYGGTTYGGATSGGALFNGGTTSGGASSGGTTSGGTTSGGASSGGASSGGGMTKGGSAGAGGSAGSSAGGMNGGGGATGSGGGGGTSGGATGGGGGATSCPGFVLCDDFQDGNISANPTWIATQGAFTVVTDGSSMVLKQAPMEAWAYTTTGAYADMTVQARMKVLDFAGTSSTNCAGLVARWQGSSAPFYMVGLCAKGTIGAFKANQLINETTGSVMAGIVANTWYSVKMKVAGTPGNVTVTVWLDDVQRFSITDTDTSNSVASGFAALGSKKEMSVEYDDFKVSTP